MLAATLMIALAVTVVVLSALQACDDWGALAMIPVLLVLMAIGRRGRERR